MGWATRETLLEIQGWKWSSSHLLYRFWRCGLHLAGSTPWCGEAVRSATAPPFPDVPTAPASPMPGVSLAQWWGCQLLLQAPVPIHLWAPARSYSPHLYLSSPSCLPCRLQITAWDLKVLFNRSPQLHKIPVTTVLLYCVFLYYIHTFMCFCFSDWTPVFNTITNLL